MGRFDALLGQAGQYPEVDQFNSDDIFDLLRKFLPNHMIDPRLTEGSGKFPGIGIYGEGTRPKGWTPWIDLQTNPLFAPRQKPIWDGSAQAGMQFRW